MREKVFAVFGFGLLAFALHTSGESKGFAFPVDYREWVHVKSALLGPQFPSFETEGGFHHIYANKEARQGFKSDQFLDGSILVYDLLSATEQGGVVSEGARRRVDVMYKNEKQYPESGGWRFQRFMGDDQSKDVLTEEQRAACISCHQSQKRHDFVFSDFRP